MGFLPSVAQVSRGTSIFHLLAERLRIRSTSIRISALNSRNPKCASSICAILADHAEGKPDRTALTFLDYSKASEPSSQDWSRGKLVGQAEKVAWELLNREIQPGSRILLLYPSCPEFVAALLGCMLARMIAVPASMPRFRADTDRVHKIAEDCSPNAMLCLGRDREGLSGSLPNLTAMATDQLSEVPNPDFPWRDLDPEAIAFLQYTSGSTGTPKGVMTTHANLLANLGMLQEALQSDENSAIVHWLPHFHDMGMISMTFGAVFAGCREVFMAPGAFLRRPLRWLEAISDYRGTITAAPNFAFEWCVRLAKSKAIEGFDLSSLKRIFNAAEPISPATEREFAEKFRPCGFRPESLRNFYGLAESTAFCSGGSSRSFPKSLGADSAKLSRGVFESAQPGDAQFLEIAGIGRPWGKARIEIVDPSTNKRVPNGEIGEIWVAGPQTSKGYWGAPEKSKEKFGAALADDLEEGRFYLRTEDLGFQLDGEFYFVGRTKETIIIRGLNYYPQDLERYVAEELKLGGSRLGIAIAVRDESGAEQLVFVQETGADDDFEAVARIIQAALSENVRLRASSVRLVKPGTITKTTSGKIERLACRDQLERGILGAVTWTQFDETAHSFGGAGPLPPNPSLRQLQSWLAEWLGIRDLKPDENVMQFGLDSLALVNLMADLDDALGIAIPGEQWVVLPTALRLKELLAVDVDLPSTALVEAWGRNTKLTGWKKWRNRLTEEGPMISNRLILGYETGHRLHRSLCGDRAWRKHFFGNREAKMRAILGELELEPAEIEEKVELSFLVNTWRSWREVAFRKSRREFRIENPRSDWLSGGAILAAPHVGFKWVCQRLPFLDDRETVMVGNLNPKMLASQAMGDFVRAHGKIAENAMPDLTALHAASLRKSIEVLERGGVAILFADDSVGKGGIRYPFHGRWRPIRPGIAELATKTDRPVVPLFPTMTLGGEITLRFGPPLLGTNILQSYGELLSARWRGDVAQLEWWIVDQVWGSTPIVENETGGARPPVRS